MEELQGNYAVIQYLSDDIIDQYAGKRECKDYRDINLKYHTYYHPYPKSVLDPSYFGSLYSDRCNCGRVHTVGEFCPNCRSRILDDVQSFSRYAKIKLPVYYISKLKFEKLYKWLQSQFRIEYDLTSGYLSKGRQAKENKALFDICQMSFEEDTDTITLSDYIIDYTKCSYEGLMEIFKKYKPELLSTFMKFVNSEVLVIPLRLRPVHRMMTKEGPKLDFHEITKIYQNIIYASHKAYPEQEQSLEQNNTKIAMLRGVYRGYFSNALENISNLMRSSKENFARTMQSTRIANSGRCTIIPGPHLKIDEVELPRTLYYEACREEFIDFLAREFNCSREHAEVLSTRDASTQEVQRAFTLFVEGDDSNREEYPGKYVIINRAPTLHEYNLMCCKVHLVDSDTMSLPIPLCVPFNADFDGDTMAWFDVPQKIAPMVVDAMSPKNMLYYKKTHQPLFLPTQEVVQGLILATKVRKDNGVKNYGDTLDELKAYRIVHKREFKYQTLIEYHGRQTTLAREILSEYFNTDVNDFIGGFDKHLTSKTIPVLYKNIVELEDRDDRILKIQQFALKVVTIAGVTSLSLEDLYSDLGNEYLKQIREVEANETLSEREKSVKIRELYEKSVKETTDEVPERVMTEVKESARMKASQLLTMIHPILTTGIKGELSLASSTIINGMTTEDMVNYAVENRGTQSIKQDNVPGGGYFTRQMVYLASTYTFADRLDTENKGIEIEERRAAGRTRLDGTIVPKSNSDKLITIRSIVTSDIKQPVITKDMISNIIPYHDKSNIGTSMITSLSEGLTQGMLGLKHGGNLFSMMPDSALPAIDNVDNVQILDDYLIVKCGDKVYKYPKPDNWVVNYSPDGTYKKGENIGYAYHTVTPSYLLDCFIKLTKARKGRTTKRFTKNTIDMVACYAIEGGKIHYDVQNGYVTIGKYSYPYNSNVMYFYPEGAEVKRLQRFCNCLLDLDYYLTAINDYVQVYYVFREQVREMAESMVDELIEFLYKLIIHEKNGQLVNSGVINSIHSENPWFTELAAENHNRAFRKLEPGGTPLISDTFGNSFLPLIINSTSLDKL